MMSKICKLMNENTDWENILVKKNIRVNKENSLAIMNYAMDADFKDPIVQEARGIIIDTKTNKVVCWPFRKFGNWQEEYADPIDWKTANVQEKIDGSIIKLWYYNRAWHWSTNGVINAENADSQSGKSFMEIIKSAINFKNIPFEKLDQNSTYIFELVSPMNPIVISYPLTKLYHIGTRSNITGQERNEEIGIEKPKAYPLNNFEDCLEACKKLNASEKVEQEGFVVVDANWNRIKIKSPEYLTAHRFMGNDLSIPKERILDILLNHPELKEELMGLRKQFEVLFKYYDFKIAELEYNVEKYIAYARGLYEELEHDRKALANTIKNDKLAQFGFSAIGNDKTAKDLLSEVLFSRFKKLIDDYKD